LRKGLTGEREVGKLFPFPGLFVVRDARFPQGLVEKAFVQRDGDLDPQDFMDLAGDMPDIFAQFNVAHDVAAVSPRHNHP